ncbi:MAG: hypothetical protein E6Q97_29400 [Desulfurellales bacterium]|nr:MAG: hypothetical protein E6Q97_29400 [Desulfurellales bacterium]
MSIYDLQSGKKYVCNLCGDERESESPPTLWMEIKNRRTETIQHLCPSCAEDGYFESEWIGVEGGGS